MKIYNVIWGLFALLILIGCEKDEYEAPNSFSDVTWVNGFAPGEAWAVNVNNPISFMDLSRGVLSHRWSIDKENYFLAPEYDVRTDTVFTEFILGSDTLSEDALVNVLFTKPGLNKIHLYNTYTDSVSWWGSSPIHSVQEGDVWVIDTTFIVDVYDSIRPAFRIYKGEEMLYDIKSSDMVNIADSATWPVIDLESGEQLTYVDMTAEGRPGNRNWSLTSGDKRSSQDSAFTVSYYYLGNDVAGTMRSSRAWPYPVADATKHIPVKINVGASNQPFTIVGGIKENASEALSFSVTGVLDKCIGEEGNFVVHVENTDAGYSGDIEVKTVSINPSNARQVDIVLKEPIYNSDAITVSYSGGNIRSVDERVLESFADLKVNMHMVNAINSDIYGFETPHGNENDRNIAQGWWLQHPPYMTRSNEQAASGSYSLKLATDAHTSSYTLHGSEMNVSVAPPAGKYLYRAKVWKDATSTITGLRVNLGKPWLLNILDLSGVETNKWIQFERTITTSDPIIKITIQLHTGESDGAAQLLYLDDIELIPVEERPVL